MYGRKQPSKHVRTYTHTLVQRSPARVGLLRLVPMTLPLIRSHVYCLNWLVSEGVCQHCVNFTPCDMFTWKLGKNAIKSELVLSFHGVNETNLSWSKHPGWKAKMTFSMVDAIGKLALLLYIWNTGDVWLLCWHFFEHNQCCWASKLKNFYGNHDTNHVNTLRLHALVSVPSVPGSIVNSADCILINLHGMK